MKIFEIIQAVLQFAIVGGVIWAIFNEDKFVSFEDKILNKWRVKK